MKRICFVLMLLLCEHANAGGGSGFRNISSIKIEGSSFIMIHATSAWSNPDGCSKSDQAMVLMSDNARQEKLSLAISAYMSGKKIGFWLSGCSQTPWGYSVPNVYTMTVSD